jgi:uncharacterized membrane protein YqiK
MSLNQIGIVVFVVAVVVGLVAAFVRGRRRDQRARELAAFVRQESLRAVRRRIPGDGERSFPSLAATPRGRPGDEDHAQGGDP